MSVTFNNTCVYSAFDLLVDCGATTHIMNNESKFINFNNDFNSSSYIVELISASRYNNLALKMGDGCNDMTDTKGKVPRTILKDVLHITYFNNNIFYVQVAIENGATVEFKPNSTITNAKRNEI